MMTYEPIRFDDGAGYEKMMGVWSRITGEIFLDWLKPAAGLKWVDVGCGNGAFTELLVDRTAPAAINGIDPSEGQIKYARERHKAGIATFQQGDAMALPFADNSFDAAAMALVIFFVPEPAKGVAEMARVVRPGGMISAYAWDFAEHGFPMEPLHAALREIGISPPMPPHPDVAVIDNLAGLWEDAGLQDVTTIPIVVHRPFEDFEAFWSAAQHSPAATARMGALAPDERERIKARTLELMPRDSSGGIIYRGRANAVRGTVPVK